MDPYAVLGLQPGASETEIAAAYRTLAKRHHPDAVATFGGSGAGLEATGRMMQINAAYDLLRDPDARRRIQAEAAGPAANGGGPSAPAADRRLGGWLPDPLRRALGRELLRALEPGEDVRIVVPAATWASPQTLLAVTDRRLLWLLDDVVSGRVRSLRFRSIAAIDDRMRRPRRRVASLRVEPVEGRRITFTGLAPATARAIADHVRASGTGGAAGRERASGAARPPGAPHREGARRP